MPGRILWSCALLVLSGCAGTRHTIDPASDAERLAWANRLFEARPSVVVLTDGTAYDAHALRLAPDTSTWVDPATRQLLAIPTSAIAVVERSDRRRAMERGVGRGAASGALTGGLLGAIGGYSSGSCLFCSRPPTASERAEGGLVFGIGGALVGAGYGAAIGVVTGLVASPTETFVVTPSTASAGSGSLPERR